MESSNLIILPDDPRFNFILGTTYPPGWKNQISGDEFCFVMGTDGLLRVANHQQTNDYLYGGEYEYVLANQNVMD